MTVNNLPALGAIGDNTIDQYFGSKNESFVGGNALNVAMQFSRLGYHTRYAGAVGRDDDGRRIRQALERNNVTTEGLVVLDGITSVSRIRVEPDGERIIEFEDFAVCADYRPDSHELDRLAGCAFVHIGMSPFAGEIRKELSRRGARISQDCAVSAGFDLLDVAFCSAGDDPAAARSMAEAAIGGGARLAVVTCGPAGSIAYDGTTWTNQAAHSIDPVDTTGAGDSFIAGFIAALATGGELQACMQAGAAAAARTCLHWGGWAQEGR